ncbi:MAG: N-acetylmuramoyl-L-alanine amidase [Rhodospirillaceae bacterium]|nr:N-acetylmuramoyl-L-alanine amidase [Rhodospirillaceae bacterium]
MALRIIERISPNSGDRQAVDGKTGVRHLVFHYTGMHSAAAALARLADPTAQVSAHYLLDEDGAITRLVGEDKRAWHAGKSFWRGVRDINSTSVGIEIVNPGHDHGYRAFPDVQIEALIELSADIIARHGIAPDNVVGHSDIAPGRKIDPGELFPWQRLAAAGIGLWPEPTLPLPGVPDLAAAFRRLSEIGYPVPVTEILGADLLDPSSAATDVIAAFQRRFRPGQVDGILDLETAAILAAVDVRYAEARG